MRFGVLSLAVVVLTPISLAACLPGLPQAGETGPTVEMPTAAPTPAATATLAATATAELPSFESATFSDPEHGLALDYPADWSSSPMKQVGSRGAQAQLLSPGTTAEALALGGSRLTITLYDWDPKNDLAAFVSQRHLAWEASGSKVLDGSVRQLSDGRPAADFFVRGPDGAMAYFLFAVSGDQYLQLAGEGDLQLIEEIAPTLRMSTPGA